MKLHLNLTLRRALLAAMAMVALHTADADMTPTNGHMYVTGEVSPTTEAWTEAWGSTTGVLSVGTSVGAGTLTLTSGNYTTPNSIFLGGKGYESNGTEAKDGTLEIEEGATLTVNGSTNVGNSQIGGKGTLTLDDGTLNAGNALYVGVNAGSGTIEADGSTITVTSGSTGAVFAMSHRTISAPEDTVTLTGSSITVGAKGGVRDYTSIGHSAGTATLYLEAGSTANFHDQTIVGEMGGSNGTIYVKGGSTLSLGTVTVLGKEAGAKGKIYIEGDESTLTADELVIGDKGIGTVEVTATAHDDWKDTYTISAKEITLGESAGGRGTLSIGEDATVGKITNLRVGREGIGTLTTEADIETDTLAIAQSGSSVTVKNYSTVDTGYLAILGGTLNIATVDENGDDTVYSDGSVNVSGATYTDAGSTINIAVGGEFTTQGGSSEINGATIKETVIGGKVNINGSRSDNGDFSYGSWNANGSTTMLGTLTNNGVLNVGNTNEVGEVLQTGSMAAMTGIIGTGTTKVAKDSELQLTGASSQSEIVNNGTMTLSSGATLTATGAVSGGGKYNILVDANTNGNASPVITAGSGNLTNTFVEIDISDASELVGKNVAFAKSGDSLVGLSQATNFSLIEGTEEDEILWDKGHITYTTSKEVTGEDGTTTTVTENNRLCFTYKGTEGTDDTEPTVESINFTNIQANITTVDSDKATIEIYDTAISGTTNESQTVKEEAITGGVTNPVTKDDTVTTVALTDKTSDTQHDIVIAKNVTTESKDGSVVTLTSTATVQETVIESLPSNQDQPDNEIIGTGGLALTITGGKTTISGTDAAILGFAEGSAGTVTTTITEEGSTAPVEVVNEVKLLDVIILGEATEVELKNDKGMTVHSTHALVINGGDTEDKRSKLTIGSGTSLVFGGSDDVNLTYEAEVKHYDENGDVVKTEKVVRKSANHITTDSEILNSDVVISEGSHLSFITIDDKDHNHHGETHITNSTVILGGEGAKLGVEPDSDTDDRPMQTIVFDDKSMLKGSGHAKHIKMNGGRLSVGNSPGELTVSEFEAKGKTVLDFTFITNSDKWTDGTGTAYSGNCDTTYGSGNLSKLLIDKAVTLDGIYVTFVYEEKIDGDDPATTDKENFHYAKFSENEEENKKQGKEALANKVTFADGDAITLIDNIDYNGDLSELSGSYTVDYDSLPTLADDLFWDVNRLFTTGKIYVIGERLEEPWRIANTLVSAGETVLNFGRLAEAQASLREAGTTRTWGSAIAMFDSIDSGSTTNGYDYSNWGAAVGIDHAFTKNTVVGVAFGCTWGENEPENGTDFYDAGSIDQDARMIGIYGVHKFQTKGLLNDVKLNAFAAYGWFENDSTRSSLKAPGTATAEWDSDAWVLSASLSRDITTDSGVVFTPYVGVEYTTAGMDDFTEKGRVTTADYSADEDYSNLAVKLGVSVSKTYGSITPYANVAFISDVDRTAAKVTATGRETITGKSALPGRNGFEIGVGATWQLTENLDVNAGYSAEIRDKATEHNARLGVGYTF
ncbi:MAG: autotransporter domain-containing protein [Akkermansia sp.]|nr:autotransporter domain-containing protein [Akkermansia sp.]